MNFSLLFPTLNFFMYAVKSLFTCFFKFKPNIVLFRCLKLKDCRTFTIAVEHQRLTIFFFISMKIQPLLRMNIFLLKANPRCLVVTTSVSWYHQLEFRKNIYQGISAVPVDHRE